MSSEVTPVVSFCIPVYNNAEAAVKIVSSLLSSDDMRFEVVVSDDASGDNAEELLRAISDERFRYFRNEKNLGAHKNWEHSLELGRGEWLYLIMGRDMMQGKNIPALIERLTQARENNITFMKDGGHKRGGLSISEGIDAMINFITYNHPTGCIFRSDLFRAIPNRTHYFEISDMYPEVYVIRDLLLKGKGAYIHSGVGVGGYASDKGKVKSTVEHGIDIHRTYFSPERRTKQFFEQVDMIESDLHGVFSVEELDRFFRAKYKFFLENVSYWWRMWCRDPVQMAHYGQPVRYIGVREMTRNMIEGYRATKAHLKEKGTYTPARHKIMLKTTAKTIIHISTKSIIRSIIEPLGIWKILHFFRNY